MRVGGLTVFNSIRFGFRKASQLFIFELLRISTKETIFVSHRDFFLDFVFQRLFYIIIFSLRLISHPH